MKFNRKTSLYLATATLSTAAMLMSAIPGKAQERSQWYFFVTNSSDSAINQLMVSLDDNEWHSFNNSYVAPGKTKKFNWYKKTDNDTCEQWIKAEFADGEESTPIKIDFCSDIDTPLVF
jgi:hypothetical protein